MTGGSEIESTKLATKLMI